jgi:hypothetical protein
VARFDRLDVNGLAPLAVNAFLDTIALVVFVVGDYETELKVLLGPELLAALPGNISRIITLSYLDGADVTELAKLRWNVAVMRLAAKPQPSLPFDLEELEEALKQSAAGPRTLKRLLTILGKLLELKEADLAGKPQQNTKTEHLRFTRDELRLKVKLLDELTAGL